MSETTSDTTLFDDTGSSDDGHYGLGSTYLAAQSFATGSEIVTLADFTLILTNDALNGPSGGGDPMDDGSVVVQLFADNGGAVGTEIAQLGTIDETTISGDPAPAPSEMRNVDADGRRLGVGVQSIRLDDRPLRLTDPRLTTGWHPAEAGLRWTDGDARVEAGAARSLTIRLHAAMTYLAHAPIGQELPFQERRRA